LVGLLFGNFMQYQLSLIIVASVVGCALVMIVGFSRVIMLATGAMMAIGAYGSAIMMSTLQLSYLSTLPVVGAFGFAAGLILAVSCIRFRGHYLAMVTLMFQMLVITGIREWTTMTGGSLGLRFPAIAVWGRRVVTDRDTLLLITICSACLVALLSILLFGRFGKSLRAIAASEPGSIAFGMDIPRYQVAAFSLSSAALAVAGALIGPLVRILDPESFGLSASIMALGYPIVGGMGSVWGGIVGGGLLRALPEMLRGLGQYSELVLALIVISAMMFFPHGIVGLIQEWADTGTKRPERDRDTAPAAVLSAVHAVMIETPGVPAVVVRHLVKRYDGLTAVSEVSLDVPAGRIHGLIGPNGAGKTTLFNAISGFVRPDGGNLTLFERSVADYPAQRRIDLGVTRTFQNVAVFGSLSCLDNVVIGLGKNRVHRSLLASIGEFIGFHEQKSDTEAALKALREVGILHLSLSLAASLSLGDQRRLEIARAIVSKPRLILLDEPVSGVSADEEERICQLLYELNKNHGMTMLIVEHNIAFIRKLCSKASVMAAGRLIAEGRPDDVVALPAVRKEYFGDPDVAA
jgi:ABC-type branched-subunit amino acid transport system ATPase component/ABC-type branched-subunit amino acid transport system permease subunit